MATITAASISQSDVQAAIDAASDGDTVSVPAGTATWGSSISMPTDRDISVVGAGKELSILEGEAFSMGRSGCRVSAFGLSNTIFGGRGTWRIDNCSFTGSFTNGVSCSEQGDGNLGPTGLIDNCEFLNARVLVLGDADLTGAAIWYDELGLGTDNAVFIEDCTFTFTQFGNCIDSNYGGRYVFRYNTVVDTYCEVHSSQNGQQYRAARSWEIYENTFTGRDQAIYYSGRMRGGTGVVFNNTITNDPEGSSSGFSNQHFGLDNVRSCYDSSNALCCDGDNVRDGNELPNGYPCRDQIGRSTDAFLYLGDDNWPDQDLEPAYAWGNTNDSGDAVFQTIQCAESQEHIQEDRDFYNGIEKPGYSAYTYPHPLRGELAPGTFGPPWYSYGDSGGS